MDLKISNKIANNKLAIIAISTWVIINIIQSVATPLHVDEAYYWMFSKHLDWGYFDHPPAVALLIRISDTIFNGPLGVRFMAIITQVLTFLIIYKTIVRKDPFGDSFMLKLFLVFCLLPLNHIFGIITTPDVPLMLSCALFFYSLRGVLEKGNRMSYMLWTIAMSMMLYSKYHSGLVILITLIAAPSLFKNWKTYVSGGVALMLFIPHILWQYDHDWASIMYHVSERAQIYSWTYPLEYLGNILVVCNPVFIFFLIKLIRKRWTSVYERVCYFVIVGFLAFFFWQSFRVRVQPQWLIVIYIPALILMRKEIDALALNKLWRLFLMIIPLFIIVRIFMIWDILPVEFNIHGKKEYVELIQKDANGLDVMFYGNYKRAAIYSWYAGQDYTHSYNGSISRKNQYNIWELDSAYFDKDVYLVGVYSAGRGSKYYEEGKYYGNIITYKPTDKLKVKVLHSEIIDEHMVCHIKIENPYDLPINPQEKHDVRVSYFKGNKHVIRLEPLEQFAFDKDLSSQYTITFPLPEDEDVDMYSLLIRHENLPFGLAYYKYSFPHVNTVK